MLQGTIRASILVACLVTLPPASNAQVDPALAPRLDELINKAGLGQNLGIAVVDTATGERIYGLNPAIPRNPASNMKLVTAATALSELGAEYRFRTTLSGTLDAQGTIDTLVLHGEGDPSLTFGDLLSMTRKAIELGVRRVEHIVVDGTYFDEHILPPAFDQQPHEVASFRAAVAAVSVDRNAYDLRVAPGPAADAPASVILRCPDYFALEATIDTTPSGKPQVIAEQRARGDLLALKVTGHMPLGIRGVSYERRIESPLSYAGYCLRAALRAQRVTGTLTVRTDHAPQGLPTLVVHESEPLAALLGPVGKHSDNFYAEMLFKAIGAHASRRPGSAAAGSQRAQQLLEQAGVAKGAATLMNGSGLFRGGAIAPEHLTKLLTYVYQDPSLRSEFVAQLAIAGKDGTLRSRLSTLKHPRIVRAKTGTLDDVIALSGYVLGPRDRTWAFSFLFNGVAGKQWAARALADDLALTLAAHLYTQP